MSPFGPCRARPAAASTPTRRPKKPVADDPIAAFELAPGDRLVETDLAARLGVSKTPLREAIALLEADGLIETFLADTWALVPRMNPAYDPNAKPAPPKKKTAKKK